MVAHGRHSYICAVTARGPLPMLLGDSVGASQQILVAHANSLRHAGSGLLNYANLV